MGGGERSRNVEVIVLLGRHRPYHAVQLAEGIPHALGFHSGELVLLVGNVVPVTLPTVLFVFCLSCMQGGAISRRARARERIVGGDDVIGDSQGGGASRWEGECVDTVFLLSMGMLERVRAFWTSPKGPLDVGRQHFRTGGFPGHPSERERESF